MAAVKTITEQVYDNIYELILNRTFAPGMKLTLKTLQEELDVSSSPIREALTRLQQDGIVDYQPNSGMKLRTYTDKEVQDLFNVLSDLDMISLKYALDNDNREILIQKLKHNTQASKAMISDVDVAEWLSFPISSIRSLRMRQIIRSCRIAFGKYTVISPYSLFSMKQTARIEI